MSNLSLLTAVQVVEKTMAYIVYRQMMWIAICFAYLFATLVGAGTLLALSAVGINPPGLGTVGGVLGFCACAYLLYRTRGMLWVPLRAGHAAVIAQHLSGETFPGGWEQIDHAKRAVRERFGDEAALFDVDQRIKGVIRSFVETEYGKVKSFAFAGGDRVRRVYDWAIGILVALLDEVVLAYHVRRGGANAFASCRDGVVLLADHHHVMRKYTLLMILFMYVGLFASFYLLLWPAGWVADLFPVSVGFWRWVFALVFAWGIKATFFDAIAMAMLAQVFFKTIEGQSPSAESAARLGQISEDFKNIAARAG